MKKFLVKIVPYLLAILSFYVVMGSFADGNTDDNYFRFTQKGENLILGDSRGAQSLVPYILNKNMQGRTFDNFALNVVHSPYGNVYLRALKRKLKEGNNMMFILTVDPWNLSADKSLISEKDFPEKVSPLADVHSYEMNPNYEYLIKHYPHTWYYIYRDREAQGKSSSYLHKDGWMEVTVDMDSALVEERKEEKVEFYNKLARNQQISSIRMDAFAKTVEFLKTKGEVFIVRIPASKELMIIENQYSPEFNTLMKKISQQHQIPYFDFSEAAEKYQYTDGNHMYKESSKIFTQQIADSIKSFQLK